MEEGEGKGGRGSHVGGVNCCDVRDVSSESRRQVVMVLVVAGPWKDHHRLFIYSHSSPASPLPEAAKLFMEAHHGIAPVPRIPVNPFQDAAR